MHHLLNVVTHEKGTPEAVLIRSIMPKLNVDLIQKRLKLSQKPFFIDGPGRVCKTLNITLKHNRLSLLSEKIWIEDKNIVLDSKDIQASKRIGIDYAGKDAFRLWRFTSKLSNIIFMNESTCVGR